MIRSLMLAVAALGLSALAGCGPTYDHIDFAARTSPPLSITLDPNGVTIPVGIAVAIAPMAIAEGGDPMEDSVVSLLSSNASVLGIDEATGGGFVMFGARTGQATISVFVDGTRVDEIPAVVVKQ